MRRVGFWTVAALTGMVASGTAAQVATPENWPVAQSPDAMVDAATEARITDLLSKLSLEEKIGQMIQGDTGSIKPEEIGRAHV